MSASPICLHHVAIVVSNLDAAVTFYGDVFGYQIVKQGGWEKDSQLFNKMLGLRSSAARVSLLQLGKSYLELFEFNTPCGSPDNTADLASNFWGLRHIAFQVDDVSQALQNFISHGGSQLGEQTQIPNAAEAVYCRDPFGNIIELIKPGGALPPVVN